MQREAVWETFKTVLTKRLNDDKQGPYQIIKKKVIKSYDSPGKHSDYVVMYVVWESKLTCGERNIISDIAENLESFHGIEVDPCPCKTKM